MLNENRQEQCVADADLGLLQISLKGNHRCLRLCISKLQCSEPRNYLLGYIAGGTAQSPGKEPGPPPTGTPSSSSEILMGAEGVSGKGCAGADGQALLYSCSNSLSPVPTTKPSGLHMSPRVQTEMVPVCPRISGPVGLFPPPNSAEAPLQKTKCRKRKMHSSPGGFKKVTYV